MGKSKVRRGSGTRSAGSLVQVRLNSFTLTFTFRAVRMPCALFHGNWGRDVETFESSAMVR